MRLINFIPVYFLLICNTALAAPAPIVTSTLQLEKRSDNSFGIGAIASVAKRPFTGVGNQRTSLPYLSYKYRAFYIEGLDIGLNMIEDSNFRLGLLATPRYYEIEAGFAKNGELDGIDKTRPTFFAGLSGQYNFDIAAITIQYLTDLKESDGNEAIVTLSKSFEPGKDFMLSPSVGLTYQDKNLVEHFYGVQPLEVRPGRPAYDGKASINYNLSLNASYFITKKLQLLGQYKHEFLGKGITDSPIVDEDIISSVTLGAVFRF